MAPTTTLPVGGDPAGGPGAASPAVTGKAAMTEIGVSGLKVYSGVVQEEFLRQLQGTRAAKVYNEMSDNDATIGAVFAAVELHMRRVPWHVEPADSSEEAQEVADFVEGILGDMSHSFEDHISEALTMLKFGWAYFETVYKVRVGPQETDPTKRSKYTDGRIGIRKLAPRAQETMVRWLIQEDGGVAGLVQLPPQGGFEVDLPIQKCLLYRTTSRKNNPEGRSILRTAYRSWYNLKTAQDQELIGIERELGGLPVVSIPARYFTSESEADKLVLQRYEKIARDVKFNSQGGLVIPSDTWTDNDGKLSATPLVKIELLSAAGTRSIDTNGTIKRYQEDIARSALAEFLMMGSASGKSGAGGGGFAQHADKSALFMQACEAYLQLIASVLNMHLLPRLWEINGLDPELVPEIVPGKVAQIDITALGTFITALAGAGAPLFPDDTLENHCREAAGLPERTEPSADVLDAQAEREQATAEHAQGLAEQGAEHSAGLAQRGARQAAQIDRQAATHGARLDRQGAAHAARVGTQAHRQQTEAELKLQRKFPPKAAPVKKGELPITKRSPFDEHLHPRIPKGGSGGGEWTAADERAFQQDEKERKRRIRGMSMFERYGTADGRVTDRHISKYDPNQPRVPSGEHGGEWTATGGSIATAARDLLAKNHNPAVTLDHVIASAGADAHARIRQAEARLLAGKATDTLHRGPDGQWTPERAALHRDILNKTFTPERVKAATPRPGYKPVATFLGGRGGSGKSFLTGKHGPADATKAITINPDDFKEALPEYKGWNAGHLHEESSYLAGAADHMARQLGLNIINDATMSNTGSTTRKVQNYLASGYEVQGHYMHAAPEVAAANAIKRFVGGGETGRYVPPEYTYNSRANETSFDHLKPAFSKWTIWDNNTHGATPRLVAAGGRGQEDIVP